MSSHMFREVERTCDRVAIIKQGKIVTQVNMSDIERNKTKVFKVKFNDSGSRDIIRENFEFVEVNHEKNRVKIRVHDKDINYFLKTLTNFDVNYISEIKLTLEDYFMQYYSNKESVGGVQ